MFAFLIDMFLIVILVSFIFSVFISKEEVALLEGIIKSSKELDGNIIKIMKTISNIVYLSLFFYFFSTNIFLKSTIGQKILNLKLISVNNKQITKYEIFNRTLMTSCVLALSGVLVVSIFFIIPLMLTKHKLTLVDIITNTSIIEFKKIS